jgi:hypothetical protein
VHRPLRLNQDVEATPRLQHEGDAVRQVVGRRGTSIPAFAFRLEVDGSITAERFGRQRRFDRLPDPVQSPLDLDGTYDDHRSGLSAQIAWEEDRGWLCLSSWLGACRLSLERIAGDLFIARQRDPDAHDAWRTAPWVLPWLYTVRLIEGGIVLSSDRTKNLVFHRQAA